MSERLLTGAQRLEILQQLDMAELTSVDLIIEGVQNHPESWRPPVVLNDLSAADRRVLEITGMMTRLHSGWNRDDKGRFRKRLTREQIYYEILTLLKGAHDFEGDADQAAIARWLDILGEVEVAE